MPIPTAFFEKPALEVAEALLGQVLVHEQAGLRRRGRIVEVEAYVGQEDLACHASKGRTPRTEVMFGPPGRAYVYLIYGMYHCFNVVTGPEGVAAAVLVRAVEPLEGIVEKTDGPGKLCRAMGLHRGHNGWKLDASPLFFEEGAFLPRRQIERGPRIGVDYAGTWAKKPFRLFEKNSPFVSRPGARRGALT